ncbi:MAG: hypothetical protein Q9221_008752 [Calogaya cf. arnoldii]
MAQRSLVTATAPRRLLYARTSHRLSTRTIHNTPNLAAGSLFDLTRLSASRESQHLSKEKGRPRTDFAPHLELIKSSEVTPFATKNKAMGKTVKASEKNFATAESNAADGKPRLESQATQEAIEKSTREQDVRMYLIREALRIQAVIKDLECSDKEINGAQGACFAEWTAQVIGTTLPKLENHIAPKDMEEMAARSPNVAQMLSKVIELEKALWTAIHANPIIRIATLEALVARKPNIKTGVMDTTYMDYMITSLIKVLQRKKQATNNDKDKPKAQTDRLAHYKIFAAVLLGLVLIELIYPNKEVRDWISTKYRRDGSQSKSDDSWATMRTTPNDEQEGPRERRDPNKTWTWGSGWFWAS